MNRNLIALFAGACLLAACSKSNNYSSVVPVNPGATTPTTPPVTTVDSPVVPPVISPAYITYLIKKGNNYCEGNAYPIGTFKKVRFKAIFDSSCIYTNVIANNQYDINKLFGFSDSATHHQQNSARFGWNWEGGKMHIHAYCYVHAQRQYKELGTVPLNAAQDFQIEVLPGKYVFTLNGKADTMNRGSLQTEAIGYKLYPYFGGDEPAPHDVRIKLLELQ